MNFLPLIETKREGDALPPAAIHEAIQAFTDGKIPDYQMAAFLMAVFFRGLKVEETRALTLAMRDSGEVLKFPQDPRPIVDKHSTGGVGDKVSLPLAPLLACLGFRVPMISGRGLGITGGTLDKLESIPGFLTALTNERIVANTQSVGCCIAGQTAYMVPADMMLYALRDVTATVPSIPLITASILSKKLAENLNALVMDVKFGAAAFMKTLGQARELASSIVTLSRECGVNTRALLTDMDTPLGRSAGNWLEVKEAVLCLEGHGPDDLQELIIACAAHLLVQTGKCSDIAVAQHLALNCLASRAPRRKFDELVVAQGGDLETFKCRIALDHTAPVVLELRADDDGYVSRCDARIIGEIVRDLGGGRMTKDSVINPDVGIDSLAKPGDPVEKGFVLARVHAADRPSAERVRERFRQAVEISAEVPALPPLIHEVIGAS